MSNFVVGVDLGQARDYTALAIVEVTQKTTSSSFPTMDVLQIQCRHLERYPLGTLYPDIVAKVTILLTTPPLKMQGDSPTLVLDATGVGRPVVDMFHQAGLYPIACLITAGDAVSHDADYWRVPKRDLVGAVQAPLQDKRLTFAADMPLVSILVQEMLNFKIKISNSANDLYGAWREGEHDDLLFAVMLACWWAQRGGGGPTVRFGTVKGREGSPVMRRGKINRAI